jgi:hypothetical protein
MRASSAVAILVMTGQHEEEEEEEEEETRPRTHGATDRLKIRLKNCGKRTRARRMWD